MGKGVYPRTPETDACNTVEDLGRYFVRQWKVANKKPYECVLMSNNINVYRAYEKMTKTGYYG